LRNVISAAIGSILPFSYDKKTPTLVCSSTSGSDEIIRWVLDRQDILYRHNMHSPPFCNGTDSIVDYIEGRSLPSNRLIPEEPALARGLFLNTLYIPECWLLKGNNSTLLEVRLEMLKGAVTFGPY
jgi:hypothetical protein